MKEPASSWKIGWRKSLFILVILLMLPSSGCVHFITPKLGSIAQKEARIPLPETGQTQGTLERQNLRIDYTLSTQEDELELRGTITFNRSLTDSFRVIKRFFLKLNFVDSEGRLLEVKNITPNFSYESNAQEKMALKYKGPISAVAKDIVFSYFGEFRGDMPDLSGTWEVSYNPFQ